MSRILITGSSEGLGLMAGRLLAEQGHEVVLHARNATRAEDARRALPEAKAVIEGDVATLAGMRAVADGANRLGRLDAVIHNVGIGYREPRRIETADGLPHVFAINVMASYVLTALIERPRRLVYLSSGMHHGVRPALDDLTWIKRPWAGAQAYAESKLYDTVLAFAVARRWPGILSNAVEPGWVPTRMGGPGAPDDMDQAHRTQAWLAASDDAAARVTGGYFHHLRQREPNPASRDEGVQGALLAACEALSGVTLPA
ncbi:SDR family NAD(P)-dependent oxidoreductase [Methylobacterium sp. J-076]|uniref:SDR family NAD(P)-dependent oxidoreductase n=1 Tax=Methylobacterium sp. J-076 TaxID=2836655 RepID=UPI001FBAB63B|nr:SDR family NAD(P)-dependent oxidoreductase [Methylobacterium sp. J-076]MCJ2012690.1 SDR family NAD(P)-dependent oxidoreductase [Methylobacterium sp. J-076]